MSLLYNFDGYYRYHLLFVKKNSGSIGENFVTSSNTTKARKQPKYLKSIFSFNSFTHGLMCEKEYLCLLEIVDCNLSTEIDLIL